MRLDNQGPHLNAVQALLKRLFPSSTSKAYELIFDSVTLLNSDESCDRMFICNTVALVSDELKAGYQLSFSDGESPEQVCDLSYMIFTDQTERIERIVKSKFCRTGAPAAKWMISNKNFYSDSSMTDPDLWEAVAHEIADLAAIADNASLHAIELTHPMLDRYIKTVAA